MDSFATTTATMKRQRTTSSYCSRSLIVPPLFSLQNEEDATTTKTTAAAAAAATTTPADPSFQPMASIRMEQVMALDGAEWKSVAKCLVAEQVQVQKQQQQQQQRKKLPETFGCISVVTFALTHTQTGQPEERWVGVRAPPPFFQAENEGDKDEKIVSFPISPNKNRKEDASVLHVYANSLARLPTTPNLSDAVVISTVGHALGHIHCVLPHVEAVGGDAQTLSRSGHVMILGGNERAVAAAQGLHALGVKVTLVTSDGRRPSTLRVQPSSSSTINLQVLSPALDREKDGMSENSNDDDDDANEDDDDTSVISVCDYLGEFDAVLDTVGDESGSSTCLRLLQNRHNCPTYVSTVSQAQRIVEQKGLVFGRGAAQQHVDQVTKQYSAVWSSHAFAPPRYLGATVQALLEAGCTTSASAIPKDKLVRSWSLSEYWEGATWPRDAGSNVRFGLPSLEADEDRAYQLSGRDDVDDEDDDAGSPTTSKFVDGDNPHVMQLVGVKGVQQEIMNPQRDGLLFLSAPFCRTCRYLTPQYQRLARRETEKTTMMMTTTTQATSETTSDTSNLTREIFFAKADATGKVGKELGRRLNIDAVPTFILFKNGRRFGKPLTITRLPSRKLELAIEFLRQDLEWDDDALRELDE